MYHAPRSLPGSSSHTRNSHRHSKVPFLMPAGFNGTPTSDDSLGRHSTGLFHLGYPPRPSQLHSNSLHTAVFNTPAEEIYESAAYPPFTYVRIVCDLSQSLSSISTSALDPTPLSIQSHKRIEITTRDRSWLGGEEVGFDGMIWRCGMCGICP